MNYSQQDELAALFAQRMTFDPLAKETMSDTVIMSDDNKRYQVEPTTFTSTHYIHPTSLASSSTTGSETSCSPPPTYRESLVSEAMAQLLIQNQIDPSALLHNQIQLFANADQEQRYRLLELWRISPPSYLPLDEHVDASWMPTSMQQEEHLARVRHETTVIARGLEIYQNSRSKSASDFDTHDEPMSPIREPGEAAWPPAARMRAASIAASAPTSRPVSQAEPYMTHGYRNSMQQSHMDPVYGANPASWQVSAAANVVDQEHMMSDQHGEIIQIRNHADWEASTRTNTNGSMDDEMIM